MASLQKPTFPWPDLPQALERIVAAAADPDTTVETLAGHIEDDPGFAVQLLQLANAEGRHRGGRIASVRRAVARTDRQALQQLAWAVAALRSVDAAALQGFPVARFWEDSLRRAVAAQMLAERDPELGIDSLTAFTVGFFQDLGVLTLVLMNPELGAVWGEVLDAPPERRRKREFELFGVTHDVIAEELASQWQLPSALAVPMRYHHAPERAPAEYTPLCRLAGWAEVLSAVLACADRRAALDRARQVLVLESDLSVATVDDLVVGLAERVTEVARSFGLGIGAQPSLESILQPADIQGIEHLSRAELTRQLQKLIREKRELSRRLMARERELERLVVSDSLTGLANHRALFGRLSYEVSRTARSGGCLSVLVVDIHDFGHVVERFGRAFADRVVQAVAVVSGVNIRHTDIAARVGGEEFAVVLPDTPMEGGQVVADKLSREVGARSVVTDDGETWTPTISVGLATLPGPCSHAFEPDRVALRLYQAADGALFRSIRSGGGMVTVEHTPVSWDTD